MEFPKGQAEKMIRGLNLFPELDVNIFEDDPALTAPKIVEKSIRLPGLFAPGTSVQDLGHKAGYYQLPHTKSARYNIFENPHYKKSIHASVSVLQVLVSFLAVYLIRMFYFFFESRNEPSTDPVFVWLHGGPGCSTSVPLFYESGPFHITNNLSLVWNDFGWDKVSNIIYVDQPTGTGFSYTSDIADIRRDSVGAANDFYDFMQAFFKAHPQYAWNDFYITGESYAGHYIPAFADRIQRGNDNKEGIHINMKGLSIGNGLTDPEIQYKAYTDYALDMKLINKSDYDSLSQSIPGCVQAIKLCGNSSGPSEACAKAFSDCTAIYNKIVKISGNINFFDIRKPCVGSTCYNFSNVENFLNQKSVREALGVGDKQFVLCNLTVYESMKVDWMRNYEVDIPALLENGVKLLVYAGEYDLICNWLGNSRWVDAMVWSGQKDFVSAPSAPFIVDGVEAGLKKSHGLLTFLKIISEIIRRSKGNLQAVIEAGIISPLLQMFQDAYDFHAAAEKEFVSAPFAPFIVDGVEAGLKKSYGLLTFLKVHNAGHMVPMDQPKASLEMIKRWMQGIPL
ncbi:unnamed protein product [Fraxinus pennsylvanica]|uniref:Carboxypeptidase n=1 Tax=Fraxinus pennsylvanica TaxID=56036 RepID=A0AAD2E5X3_9LAMI|nr:unnamed protein product [Fraxinus pennsylvanica]